MKLLSKKLIKCLAFIFLGFFVLFNSPTLATNKPEYSQLLTPTKQNLILEPGENFNGYFKITNNGTKPFKFKVYTESYQISDENYSVLKHDIDSKYSYITNWVTFEKEVYSLEPSEATRVNFTINVPASVPSGGQYTLLISEMFNEDTGEIFQTINRLGMNLYTKISGETHYDGYGEILENNIQPLFLKPPISASFLVKNNGNVHAHAISSMTVYSLFSNKPVWTNAVNHPVTEDYPIVLPETSRSISNKWEGSPRLGIFKVIQKVEFMGETDIKEKLILICPLWFILLIFATIISFTAYAVTKHRPKKQ